jgi:hypothetical protein
VLAAACPARVWLLFSWSTSLLLICSTSLLAHRCRTNENPATRGQRWSVHHASAVETRPGGMSTATRTARLVPDEHRAGAERVTVRAALRWPRHPRAIGAADQLADCGHESTVGRLAFTRSADPAVRSAEHTDEVWAGRARPGKQAKQHTGSNSFALKNPTIRLAHCYKCCHRCNQRRQSAVVFQRKGIPT